METVIPTIIATLIFLGLAVFGMAIKIFLTKDQGFSGGCASNNTMLRDKVGACGVCGKTDFDDSETPKIETSELPTIGQ